ncbi:MAG: hypothetical protein ACE5GM_04990 [bacterium]
MEPDLLSRLAESQNVALALSLLGNGILGRSLIKLYHSKEELHIKLVEILREIIPLAVRLKDKIDRFES